MSLGLQILPYLSLILLVWNQVPGLQGQEFRFGPCQVTGVVLPDLWEAFRTVKNTVVRAGFREPFCADSPIGGGNLFRTVDPFPDCSVNFKYKNPDEFRKINKPHVTHRETEAHCLWAASSQGSKARGK